MESIRVDATLLESFQRKTVRIIGNFIKINESEQSSIIINSNGNIILKFSSDGDPNYEMMNSYGSGHYFEVIGLINDDLTVKVIQALYFGQGINEKGVLKLVNLCHKVPDLFYSTNSNTF